MSMTPTLASAPRFDRLPFSAPINAPVRVLAIAVSAGVAGALFYGHLASPAGGLPVWALAGLMYAVMVGASAAVMFRLLPRFRQFVELTALSRLLLALASIAAPDLAVAMTTSPLLNATLVVGGAMLLRGLARARHRLPARLLDRRSSALSGVS